jgi:hypothetical protein
MGSLSAIFQPLYSLILEARIATDEWNVNPSQPPFLFAENDMRLAPEFNKDPCRSLLV